MWGYMVVYQCNVCVKIGRNLWFKDISKHEYESKVTSDDP